MGNQPTFNLFIEVEYMIDYFFQHSSEERNKPEINFLKKKYGIEFAYFWTFTIKELLIKDFKNQIDLEKDKKLLMSELNIQDENTFDNFIKDCIDICLFNIDDNILYSDKIGEHINKVKDISKKRSIAVKNRYKKTDSPIEELFYNKLKETLSEEDFNLFIPQYEILPYYVDFGIPSKKIVIELDGHEFHSSKTQRTNDLKRQRYLQGLGWTVIRYTGTEIYKNLDRCVDDLLNLIKLDNE